MSDILEERLHQQEQMLVKWRKEEEFQQFLSFLDGQEVAAQTVRTLCADRDSTDVDEMMGWIAEGGLGRDALAASVAYKTYFEFIEWREKGDPVETHLQFYKVLRDTFQRTGVTL